jgi:hypothetical protein
MQRLLICLAIAFGAAVQGSPSGLNPNWAVVLPDGQAKAFWQPRLCNRPAPGPIQAIWTPDATTITQLESVLGGALQAAIDRAPESRRSKPVAGDYYRQYAGFVVSGKRIVYINGLHQQTIASSPRPGDWKVTAANPCDGGMLFFGAEYDVETGKVLNILFNGGGRGRTPASPPAAADKRRRLIRHNRPSPSGTSTPAEFIV